jgi:hypothetical protein
MAQDKRIETVFRALSDYADAVRRRLNDQSPRQGQAGSSSITSIDTNLYFLSMIAQLENSKLFAALAARIEAAFLNNQATKQSYSQARERLKGSLKHFLRRSRFYLDLRRKEKVDISTYSKELCARIPRTNVKTHRLRLLNGVAFPQNEIKFNTFSIRKFNPSELILLFSNDVNAIFYPYAQVDTDLLSQFWFIQEEHTENWEINLRPAKQVNLAQIPSGDLVPRKLPDKILQMLSLYDWRPYFDPDFEYGFFGFTVPYTLNVDDCLFRAPRANRVDASRLWWTVVTDNVTNEDKDVPERPFEIDRDHLAQFRQCIQSAETFLVSRDLQAYDWDFFDVAFGHLAKAFFAEDSFEQLLWHIVVLEALFSEEHRNVVSSIRDRLATVLGNTQTEKTQVRKTFKSLYDFRSVLVHGKKYERKVDAEHLTAARELARRSIAWCLESLTGVCSTYEANEIPIEEYPTRAELLAAIDATKDSRNRIRRLLNTLPSGLDR